MLRCLLYILNGAGGVYFLNGAGRLDRRCFGASSLLGGPKREGWCLLEFWAHLFDMWCLGV